MTDPQLIEDLSDSLRNTIDSYAVGHKISVATAVGILHCIANEIIMEQSAVELMGDPITEEDDDEPEF